MAAIPRFAAPNGKIVAFGTPMIQFEATVEVADNMYPGRLGTKGTTVADVVACSAIQPPSGWVGYEQTAINFKKDEPTDIYEVGDRVRMLRGNHFIVNGRLAKGCKVIDDQLVANWTAGEVVGPVIPAPGGIFLGIPFTKNATEKSTFLELPAGVVVTPMSFIEVTTAVAGATIDVGLLSSESGGDTDGFIDGASCAATGIVAINAVDETAANNTLGVLLVEADIKSADSTALYQTVGKWPGYVGDGVAKTIVYQTSDHDVAGTIWLHLLHPNLRVVGSAQEEVDATAASNDVLVENYL